MLTKNLQIYAKSENKIKELNEIIDGLKKHDDFYFYKTSLPAEFDDVTDPKNLLGYNTLRYLQLLLYRSKTLIEGSVCSLNNNCSLSAILSVRAHFETTGCVIFLLRRLNSYYKGNIDFNRLDNDLMSLALGSTTIQLPEVPSPINVMNLIDSVDEYLSKNLPKDLDIPRKMFRELYEDLCEFCHPNFHGITSGSEIIHEEKSITYNNTGEITKNEFTFFFRIRTSIFLFLHGYEEVFKLIKNNEIMPIIKRNH